MVKPDISVIIPAKDEEPITRDTVTLVTGLLEEISGDYEVILIDDGSSDGTGAIMEDLRSRNGRIRVIHHGRNEGIGASLKSGFSLASKDIILYLDMDLPAKKDDIAKAVSLLQENGCDIVSAYRHNWRRESALHGFFSYVYNKLIILLFGVRLKDINFACKVFRRKMLERIPVRSRTSFVKAEFLIRADKMGYKIMQFPVRFNQRKKGRSKFNNLGRIWEIFIEMLYFRINKTGL